MLRKKSYEIFAIIMGVVFIISAILKIISLRDFVNYIETVINSSYTIQIANIIIGIELYLSLQLLFSKNKKPYFIITLLVYLVFTLFLIIMFGRGTTGNCFCFGTYLNISYELSITKNIIVITFLLYYIIKYKIYIIPSLKELPIILCVVIISLILLANPINVLEPTIEGITTKQLAAMLSYGNALVIDARSEEIYNKGHIYGAINIPFKGQSSDAISINNNSRIIKNIVTYCDSKYCSLAYNLAVAIKEKYETFKVLYYVDGYDTWEKQNKNNIGMSKNRR